MQHRALLLLAGMAAAGGAAADTAEMESNDSCAAAQPIADTVATGALASGDVDYFKFTLTPGKSYVVKLRGSSSGGGTLRKPLLGHFDAADCRLSASNHLGGEGFDARINVSVDESGEVILAVATQPNSYFRSGSSIDTGSYRLEIFEGHQFHASAKLVDRYTREPIGGVATLLYRCYSESCGDAQLVTRRTSSADGVISYAGQLGIVDEGMLLFIADAPGDYLVGHRVPFTLTAEDRDYRLGAQPLDRPPLAFVDQFGCGDAVRGELCHVVFRVENRTPRNLPVRVWGSMQVRGSRTHTRIRMQFGAEPGQTAPRFISLPPGITDLPFAIEVPAGAELGPTDIAGLYYDVYIAPARDLANIYLTVSGGANVTDGP